MSPSYETKEIYQRLVKNAINQNLFLLPNMKYESIKYEVIFWKIKKTKSPILGDIFQTEFFPMCPPPSNKKNADVIISGIL